MITNQSHAERNAGFHRVADCGGNSGGGHRHDEGGVDGMFARELAAQSFAAVIHAAAKNGAVRPREKDMFKKTFFERVFWAEVGGLGAGLWEKRHFPGVLFRS